MTDDVKLPRKLSDEPSPRNRAGPAMRRVIEQLDRWANSPELQPPKLPDEKTI